MKTIQRLFILTLLLNATFIYAQNGFIEIEVRDSVSLKAISYEYNIMATNSFDVDMEDYEDNENINKMKSKNKEKMALSTIETFLKDNKYNYKSLNDTNYNIGSNIYGFDAASEGYTVFVSSLSDLKKITNELKGTEGISGSVTKVIYEESSKYEDILLKKIIDQSKVKAQKIASLSGLTLGKIIEVKESTDSGDASFMSIMTRLQRFGKNSWPASDLESTSYSKSYIIKFKAD
jgi:uncharacterized protein YggE